MMKLDLHMPNTSPETQNSSVLRTRTPETPYVEAKFESLCLQHAREHEAKFFTLKNSRFWPAVQGSGESR